MNYCLIPPIYFDLSVTMYSSCEEILWLIQVNSGAKSVAMKLFFVFSGLLAWLLLE